MLYRLHKVEDYLCIVVWDLGLSEYNLAILNHAKNYIHKQYFVVYINTFYYHSYPSHFNINRDAGYYAWKPFVIYNTYKEYKKDMLWLDCGCYITDKLDTVYKLIKRKKIYTVDSGTTIQKFTYYKLFDLLDSEKKLYNKRMCSAGVIGLHYPSKIVDFIFSMWKACVDFICRSNHRQDQSVLSILLHKYFINFSFCLKKGFITHFDKKVNNYNSSQFNSFLLKIDYKKIK